MKFLLTSIALFALVSCSTRDIGSAPSVRRVAVSYAGSAAAAGEDPSTGARVGRHVAKRGASTALGMVGLGWANEVFDLANLARGAGEKEGISPAFRQQCLLSGADPMGETAKAFERRLARNKVYTLDATAPEAMFRFSIVRADLAAVDQMGQFVRPALTVRATLIDRGGKTLWQRQGQGTSQARTWSEYGGNAKLFKSDLAAAADAAAAELIAKLSP